MSILATKLYIPPLRAKIVLRPRLIQILQEGLHRKLTLISAPAGFGKTSIASEWISTSTQPTAWLSLDKGDNDLAGFLTYLIASLQTVSEHLGEGVLAVLQTPKLPSIDSILTILLNDISAVQEDFTLVLDDYHSIESKEVDHALKFLLEHLPPQMHLMITTREDPQLPLARFRAQDQLTELRAADLRFTSSEAALFLNQMMGLRLTEENISALELRTEGWIAGLQLAALSMQGYKDVTNFIQSFSGSHHFVMDYLVEEVLQQQSEQVQSFLLRTSILERLCGPLCDALLSGSNLSGKETLEQIENLNLFVIPLDNERRWYRYHHLFADLLRERLRQSIAESAIDQITLAELHQRASKWYEENGYRQEAIHHAIAAADYHGLAGLAELAWPEMSRNFQPAVWLGWVQHLPETVLNNRPVLLAAYAEAVLDLGEIQTVETRLQAVESLLEKGQIDAAESNKAAMIVVDEEQYKSLAGTIAITRAYHAQWQAKSAETVQYAKQALELLPDDNYVKRGSANALMALSFWSIGDLEATFQSFTDCVALFKLSSDIQEQISGTTGLALSLMAMGRLKEAKTTFERFMGVAAEQDVSLLNNSASRHMGLCEIDCAQGHLEEAKQHFNKALKIGEQVIIYRFSHLMSLLQMQLKLAQGEMQGALEALEEAEHNFIPTPVPITKPLEALKAYLFLKQGRIKDAQAWAKKRGLSVEDQISYLNEYEYITYARILLAEFVAHKATQTPSDVINPLVHPLVSLLERLLEAAANGHRIASQIEILILLALAFQEQGDSKAALASIEKSLAVAELEGYVQLFLSERETLTPLLSKAALQGESCEYARMLLAANKVDLPHPQESVSTPVPQPIESQLTLAEPLSPRELEVLQLIAEGLSNQEISERLYLALSTVKGHNQNIFGKLQAQRRTEAIIRARELGIL